MRSGLLVILLSFPLLCGAQRLYTGLVSDSATLVNIAEAHVRVVPLGRKTKTNALGFFSVSARPADTLVITCVGYREKVIPLHFAEDALLILLSERVYELDAVTVRAKRLYPDPVHTRNVPIPRHMDALDGIVAPFDYFSKWQREKRTLARKVEQDNETQVYRQVITNPAVQKIMQETYRISEAEYFSTVARFNQQHLAVHYWKDADDIMDALHRFFQTHWE